MGRFQAFLCLKNGKGEALACHSIISSVDKL
jgi:hypothetical protein